MSENALRYAVHSKAHTYPRVRGCRHGAEALRYPGGPAGGSRGARRPAASCPVPETHTLKGGRARADPAGPGRPRPDRRGRDDRTGNDGRPRWRTGAPGHHAGPELDAIGVEGLGAGDYSRRYGLRSSARSSEPQGARPRGKLGGSCWMRSRAPRGRRSKTCPLPRAGCRIRHAPPSPGSASARGYDVRLATMGVRRAYRLVPAVRAMWYRARRRSNAPPRAPALEARIRTLPRASRSPGCGGPGPRPGADHHRRERGDGS